MKFCDRHWTALRAALDEHGLMHLVAKDSKEIVNKLASEAETGRTVDNYDPLMAAHNAILRNVMQSPVGLSVMYPNEDGSERCPLCFLTAEHKKHCDDPDCTIENYDDWIQRAADDQLAYWTGSREDASS